MINTVRVMDVLIYNLLTKKFVMSINSCRFTQLRVADSEVSELVFHEGRRCNNGSFASTGCREGLKGNIIVGLLGIIMMVSVNGYEKE